MEINFCLDPMPDPGESVITTLTYATWALEALSLRVHSVSAAAVPGGHRESWAPLGKLGLEERTACRPECDSSEVAGMVLDWELL